MTNDTRDFPLQTTSLGESERVEEDKEPERLAVTLMVQGTASDVGKSLVTAALCRIFAQDGLRTAPFKSQNMSLNSYVTWEGKEIGVAQGMQADACGVPATTDMNPILLKPSGEMKSQVVVHGKPLGDFDARTYRENYLPVAGGIVREALHRLRRNHDIVVLEGAGSPAEINLKDRDIVNMQMAAWAEAPVILVSDIDRGGVFASIVGTLELLEPEERKRICGFVINKFRGDVSLLKPGLDWLERRTGKPVLGVLPYLPRLELEAEDSLSLGGEYRGSVAGKGKETIQTVDIVVIRLPRIANFTDFDPLLAEADVSLRYVESPEQWGRPDAVILPGSKNTIGDLLWLRSQGLDTLLLQHARGGGWLTGICGGYEMMARHLRDPLGVESDIGQAEGLDLFPLAVAFKPEKTTVRVEGFAHLRESGPALPIEGYEIHMGVTAPLEEEVRQPFRIRAKRKGSQLHQHGGSPTAVANPYAVAADSDEGYSAEGVMSPDGRIWGTFLHGVFHNDDFRREWLNAIRSSKGWEKLAADLRFRERREAAFDRLAEQARQHLDLPLIRRIAGIRPMEEKS